MFPFAQHLTLLYEKHTEEECAAYEKVNSNAQQNSVKDMARHRTKQVSRSKHKHYFKFRYAHD